MRCFSIRLLCAAGVGILASAYAQEASTPPPMMALTITFSDKIATANAQQGTKRVIAYRPDYSVSDTYFWNGRMDRMLEMYRPDGYFREEIYSDVRAKITFPESRALEARHVLHHSDPRQGCLKTFAGKSATGMHEKVAGTEKLMLPGVGRIDTVKTIGGDPSMTLTSWYAPSLGCAEVQRVARIEQANGSFNVNGMYPVAVTIGMPDPKLFSDEKFTETDPLHFVQMRMAAHGNSRPIPLTVTRKAEAYRRAWALYRTSMGR